MCSSHPLFSCRKTISLLTLQATGGSFLTVCKTPPDALPENAVYRSSLHTPAARQAQLGVLSSARGSAIHSPWRRQSHPEKMSKGLSDSSRHSLGRPAKNRFSEIHMGKRHLQNQAKRKHGGSSATCDNSDCRKRTSPLERSSALLCCHLPHGPSLFLFYRYQKHKGPEASGHLSTNGFSK